jgi:large subunit ribosomal protein L25
MAEINLSANKREIVRKSTNKQLRKNGKIPGIYYHKNDKPVAIEVNESALKPIVFTSETHIISLAIEQGNELPCILKNVQLDPVTERIVHFDLQGISRNEIIEIEVPVLYSGNPAGIKQGGILQQVMHKLLIECLPANIPEHIEVNIDNLNIGDSIHVSNLNLDNVKFLNAADSVLVSVVPPKIEKESTPVVEGEELAEPEVISKGKLEKEEE